MKKITSILFIAIFGIFCGDAFAQQKGYKECEAVSLAKPFVRAKGNDANAEIIPSSSKIVMLPAKASKTRGTQGSKCLISLKNYNSQILHVYVDSNYIGSVRANSVGVIESLSKFSKVYCISDDQNYYWLENGDCSCARIYHLRVNPDEGELHETD
jgi:hypothetical protein